MKCKEECKLYDSHCPLGYMGGKKCKLKEKFKRKKKEKK